MGLLAWIVLGFLAGSLAGIVTGRRGEGCITRVAVGVLGALIGGALARAAGIDGVTFDELTLRSVLVAAVGASLLLLLLQALGGGRHRR